MEQLKNLATELISTLCNTELSIEALPIFERDLKRLKKKASRQKQTDRSCY